MFLLATPANQFNLASVANALDLKRGLSREGAGHFESFKVSYLLDDVQTYSQERAFLDG